MRSLRLVAPVALVLLVAVACGSRDSSTKVSSKKVAGDTSTSSTSTSSTAEILPSSSTTTAPSSGTLGTVGTSTTVRAAASVSTTSTTPTTAAPSPTTAAPTTTPPPATAAIAVKNFAFSPGTTRIGKGATVTVTNQDSAGHTWTADNGAWNDSLSGGASASRRFDAAGTFAYHCAIHPSMTGSVVVS